MRRISNSMHKPGFTSWRALSLSLAASTLVAACGGGAGTEAQQPSTLPTNSDYTGPPPATAEIQAFMLSLWTHTRAGGTASCGDCHSPEGGISPMFGRSDDVNAAFAATNPLVDLDQPNSSRLATKLLEDHNCWLPSDTSGTACSDIMTAWIENWVGGDGAGGGRQIQLQAPDLYDPGVSKDWPPPVPAEFSALHDITVEHCGDCHASDGALAQNSPFFGDSVAAVAYEAIKSKVNLDDPGASRVVVRLRNEFHNCWEIPADGEVDCEGSANAMQGAIAALAAPIVADGVDEDLVISKALTLLDGTVASGGNRFENNQIALWEFKEGSGSPVTFDTSGVTPAVDLTLSGDDIDLIGGWGIDIRSGKAQASTAASRKLHDLISATGEYSVEAWVAPGNVTQEDAHIVSYSAGTMARNFTLGQTLYSYDAYNRSGSTNANGDPVLTTSDADEDLQATLQHVVLNYDPINGRRIYVNGEFTDDLDPVPGDTLADWDDSFAFVLGNEVSNNRQWQGVIRMVAIHNRTLTEEQIRQNLDVGVGEKFFLLFSIADVIGAPDTYILFEVSQFDNYSYLFNTPTFISLDDETVVNNVPLVGMKIGVNGGIAEVGQAYATLNTALNEPLGQILSNLGTVVQLENGPEEDEFFLSFDQLGGEFGPVTPPATLNPPPEVLAGPQPDVGIRTFDEINATMSEVTGVPATAVQGTYDLVRQQLPGEAAVMTFSSAQQIGIAQLAIGYCDTLVEDNGYRTNFFGSYNFDAAPAVALAQGIRGGVITPLINEMMGLALESQPDFNDSYAELDALIGGLIDSTPAGQTGSPQRTRDITKAACAAVLGSAPMLVQ